MEQINSTPPSSTVDFANTQIAFANKTNNQLRKAQWLFSLMNNATLVKIGSQLGMIAVKWHLPVQWLIKKTIFEQFCGGTTLTECQQTADNLAKYQVLTILDYGVEAKETDEDFDNTLSETLKALQFAAKNRNTVPVVSCKLTGLARFSLLEKFQTQQPLNTHETTEWQTLIQRLDAICSFAAKNQVAVFIDAEESWIQNSIDHLTDLMMEKYNHNRVAVYNTFQMYRHDRLQFLQQSYQRAQQKGYMLGAKLVRGAYMEKERKRANELQYQSPIQPSKEATDNDYNKAILFCIDRYQQIAFCNASHNQYSAQYMTQLIDERKLQRNHPHLNFCQLFGMSDHLSFNLAKAGFTVAKYLPYGPVKDVMPYLIRRAQENTSVTGDMSREYTLIKKEATRRKI